MWLKSSTTEPKINTYYKYTYKFRQTSVKKMTRLINWLIHYSHIGKSSIFWWSWNIRPRKPNKPLINISTFPKGTNDQTPTNTTEWHETTEQSCVSKRLHDLNCFYLKFRSLITNWRVGAFWILPGSSITPISLELISTPTSILKLLLPVMKVELTITTQVMNWRHAKTEGEIENNSD